MKKLVVNVKGKKFRFNARRLAENLFKVLAVTAYILATWAIWADGTMQGVPSGKMRFLISLPAIIITLICGLKIMAENDEAKRKDKINRRRNAMQEKDESDRIEFLSKIDEENKTED